MKKFTNYIKGMVFLIGLLLLNSTSAQTIMDVNAFRTQFNSYSNEMRVVIISDPSCGTCIAMVEFDIIPAIEDPAFCGLSGNIKYFFNWTKVLGGATFGHATTQSNNYTDSRYFHYWDEFQALGDLYMPTLGLVDPSAPDSAYTAWHTIMCYAPGVTWNVANPNPPAPTFWMHKLSTAYNADQNLYFTDAAFKQGFGAIACANSVEEFMMNEQVEIYPNPSRGDFTISYDLLKENGQFIISDVLGSTIKQFDLSTQNGSINVSNNMAPGVYFCTYVENNKKLGTKKFIITK